MKSSLFKKTLITLLVLMSLCSIFVALNYFTARKKVSAQTVTVGSLEQGDSLERANFCTSFGDLVSVTNTIANDSDPGNGVNYPLNGANAIKFNVKLNSGNIWNHYFTLFTPKSDSAYYDAPRFNLFVGSANPNKGKFSFAGEDSSVYHNLPDNVDFASAGATYDIEIGGLGIYNGSSEYKGTYYYLKINDSLIYEYYKYGNEKPTGTYFNVAANSTSVTYTGTLKPVTVGSLEQGDSLEQANFCTMFGDQVSVTNTIANDGDPGNGVNYPLNGANAIKFNVKLNSANIWNHYFAIYNESATDAYSSKKLYFMFAVGSGNGNRGKFAFYGESATPIYHALPGVDFASAGATYDIEIGGLGIYNGSSEYKGTYYYLKINDSLIYEYYKYGNEKPTGTYFNVAANSTSVTYTGVEQVAETYTVKTVVNGQEFSQKVIKGKTFVLPNATLEDNVFVGWLNGDNLYCEGKEVEVNGDITYTAKFVRFATEYGAQVRLNEEPALRFLFRIATDDRNGLSDLVSSVSFGAKITSLDKSGYLLKENIENWFAIGKNYDGVEYDVYTVAITDFNIGDVDYSNYRFVPNGIMKIEYSDGTVKSFNASGESFSRSLAEVCYAIVNDYSETEDSEYNVLYDGKYYREGLTVSGIEYAIEKANNYNN